MKKWFKAVSTAIVCAMSVNMLAAMGTVYAAEPVTSVVYDYNNKTPGDTITGGKHSAFDASWTEYAVHPENQTTAIKFHQGSAVAKKKITMYYGDWQHQVSSAFFGDSTWEMDVYRESTTVNLEITLRGWQYKADKTATRDMFLPSKIVTFTSDGKIKLFDSEIAGDYKARTNYHITATSATNNDTNKVSYTVTVSGGGQNYTSTKEFNDTVSEQKFFGSCYIQFEQYEAASTGVVADWIDNVSISAADPAWTTDQISSDGILANDTTAIKFHTPRYIAKSTMTNVKVKGGRAEITPTITYGRDLDGVKFNANDFSDYAADPTFTFASALEPGSYTIDFGGATDNYGVALENISFTVPAAEVTPITVKGDGATLEGTAIKGILKGTTPANLITLADGATAVYYRDGKEISAATPLFGGETIAVTLGGATTTYTVEARDDLWAYDFNDAKTASELEENQVLNAANRPSAANDIKALLKNTFPGQDFLTYDIKAPTSGSWYIEGAAAPGKPTSDKSAAIVLDNYVNSSSAQSAYMRTNLASGTDKTKHYVFNVSVRPGKNVATRVYLKAGVAGSSYKNNFVGIDFNESRRKIELNSQSVSGTSPLYLNGDWYTLSYYVSYDAANKKYVSKAYVNGEYVGTAEKSLSEMNNVTDYLDTISLSIEQYCPAKTEAFSAVSYFDNISFYECAALEGDTLPNSFDFVPTAKSDMTVLDNVRGEIFVPWMTAGEMCGALELPEGVTAQVQSADEKSWVADGEYVAEDMKLVLKNGEVWRSYTITPAAYKNGSLGLPGSVSGKATYIIAAYDASGKLLNVNVAEGGSAAVATDGAAKVKCFAFQGLSNIKPALDCWEIPLGG